MVVPNTEIIKKCLDNTATEDNYTDLGILFFAKQFFPKQFNDAFGHIHYKMCRQLLNLLNPSYEFVVERQRYMLLHREAAKTAIGTFLFPLYLIYFRNYFSFIKFDNKIEKVRINENYILIVSETKYQSEEFVSNLKRTIETRSDLVKIFGEKDPRIIVMDDEDRRRSDKHWRMNAFETQDGTIVHGLGSGQRVRGTNQQMNRPSLVIVDDMYSSKNTKTEENRIKINNWFSSELMNSLDSKKGKILWMGTMVHADTVVADFRIDPDWTGIEIPIMSKEELNKAISMFSSNGKLKIPDKETCTIYDKQFKSLSWPERKGIFYILHKYQSNLLKGQSNWFYQEFMNEYIDPKNKEFLPESFHQTPIKFIKEGEERKITFMYDGKEWKGNYTIHVGVDPAASAKENSDDTVIVVGGMARCFPNIPGIDWTATEELYKKGVLFPFIAHIEGGKYSLRNYQDMPGMCERLSFLAGKYRPEVIKVEANGQQMQIVREIQRAIRDGIYSNSGQQLMPPQRTKVQAEFHNEDKRERVVSVWKYIVQQNGVVICQPHPNIDKLYFQLITIGMDTKSDYCDAGAIMFKRVTLPDINYTQTKKKEQVDRYNELKKVFQEDAAWYL